MNDSLSMNEFLSKLSILLKDCNVSILSTRGSIGFIKDCHEKSREELITNRNMINSYDATFFKTDDTEELKVH